MWICFCELGARMEYLNTYSDQYLESISSEVIRSLFKVQIIDWTETNIIEDISDNIINNSGSLSINYQQGVRRSFSFQIINIDEKYTPSADAGVFYFGTKIKLYIGVESTNREDIYWWSQGVFVVTDASNTYNGSEKTVSISSVDKFGVFGSELGYSQLAGDYKIENGTKIYDIIKDILSIDMENGYIVDYIKPILDPNFINEVMPYQLVKNKGEYIGDILISLANILGSDIFYDQEGVLNISSGTEDVTYSQKGVLYSFSEDSIEISSCDLKFDYSKVINCLTVTGTNINDKLYSYTAKNTNPFSSTRIEYIGLRESEPIESAMISSEKRAEDYSKYLLNKMSILQSSLSFHCTLVPHLDVNNVVLVTKDYYKFYEERFILQEISISISSPVEMSISCSNISELPYYESEDK